MLDHYFINTKAAFSGETFRSSCIQCVRSVLSFKHESCKTQTAQCECYLVNVWLLSVCANMDHTYKQRVDAIIFKDVATLVFSSIVELVSEVRCSNISTQ